MRRFLVTVCAVAAITLSVAGGQASADATVKSGTVDFGATPGCMFFADVGLGICGFSGTVDYDIVITPSGNENSQFDVHDFTGCVTRDGTEAGCFASFTSASAQVLLHRSSAGSFAIVNDGPEGIPHRIELP